MKKITNLLTFLAMLLLVGCAAPIKAPSENDATAKVFTPVKDKAVVFIYRNENMGIWKARSYLRQVDEKMGMEGVLESVLLTPNQSDEVLSKTAIVKK